MLSDLRIVRIVRSLLSLLSVDLRYLRRGIKSWNVYKRLGYLGRLGRLF